MGWLRGLLAAAFFAIGLAGAMHGLRAAVPFFSLLADALLGHIDRDPTYVRNYWTGLAMLSWHVLQLPLGGWLMFKSYRRLVALVRPGRPRGINQV